MDLKVPQHVAIIMDGNGRWAENRGLPRIEGHQAGIKPVEKVINCCLEKNIPVLSLFAFSSENWSRPSEEVNFLMELLLDSLRQELAKLTSNGIQIRFTGDRTPLSPALQKLMQESEAQTQINHKLILNIVLNYGGKWDIVTAAKKMTAAVLQGTVQLDDINETVFAQFLDTNGLPDPDLFIRTSGELRLSNFFLWQLAYTELYFSKVHWPDFDEQEFESALASYKERKRRFGHIEAI